MKSLTVVAFTKYGRVGASSRMRSFQYKRYLVDANCDVSYQSLVSDDMLLKMYASKKYSFMNLAAAYSSRVRALLQSRDFDVVWIEKEALPWLPVRLELTLLRGASYVLDYDDAVFHSYDMHKSRLVRSIFGSRLDRLMRHAALVTAGNQYLAMRAIKAGARWVEILPTVVDLDRYPLKRDFPASDQLRIVWIGSPSTAKYLSLVHKPLQELSRKTSFVLRIVGVDAINIPGVNVECIPWTEDSEVDSIFSCAIGIMPLEASPWEQGKCGYKLIQYMACALPVVASAVGANKDIVEDGVNGFLATGDDQWILALKRLLEDAELRKKMGWSGRSRVEEKYCLQKTGPRLAELLKVVGENKKICAA